MDYYPFGASRLDTKAGSFNEQRKYIGQEYDASTGLNYLNVRYYNATLARFISEDPQFWDKQNLQDPQSFNTYSYAGNNPIENSDPSGRSWKTEIQGFATGAVIGATITLGAVAAVTVAPAVTPLLGVAAIIGTIGITASAYTNYQAYDSGKITKDQFDYNSGVMLGGLILPIGLGKLTDLSGISEASQVSKQATQEIGRNSLPLDAQKLLSEYESNDWQKATSGETKDPYPYINKEGYLPDKGVRYDAQYKMSRGQNTDRFVRINNGDVYYTNNHYGQVGNGHPPFYKVTGTTR